MKIYLTVKPGSHEDVVRPIDATHYEVSVKAPAYQNKANLAVIELLARHFSQPKSLIKIIRGEHTKKKTVEIDSNIALF